jgi:sortase (surface protein transpeptidase)
VTRSSRRLWWSVLAAGTCGLLLGLVVLVRGLAAPPAVDEVAQVRGAAAVGASEPATAPSDEPTPSAEDDGARRTDMPRVTRSDAALSEPRPVVPPERLRVPSLGLDLPVRPTGVGRAGEMRLPPDPRVLGWYRFGPVPGSGTGSAVVAGHVDSRRFGIGPLARLAAVVPGDTVRVRSATGIPTTYRVDSIERFDRQRLPDDVFTRTGPERLRLVTCTGAWIPEAGGYQQNLVVTAVPVRAG